MMHHCLADDCRNRSGRSTSITFHASSRDASLAEFWARRSGETTVEAQGLVQEMLGARPGKRSLCSRHFEESMFELRQETWPPPAMEFQPQCRLKSKMESTTSGNVEPRAHALENLPMLTNDIQARMTDNLWRQQEPGKDITSCPSAPPCPRCCADSPHPRPSPHQPVGSLLEWQRTLCTETGSCPPAPCCIQQIVCPASQPSMTQTILNFLEHHNLSAKETICVPPMYECASETACHSLQPSLIQYVENLLEQYKKPKTEAGERFCTSQCSSHSICGTSQSMINQIVLNFLEQEKTSSKETSSSPCTVQCTSQTRSNSPQPTVKQIVLIFLGQQHETAAQCTLQNVDLCPTSPGYQHTGSLYRKHKKLQGEMSGNPCGAGCLSHSPQTSSRQEPVTFDDIAVYFSEEEWDILEGWQKEIYKDVMRENYGMLASLGFPVPSPEVFLSLVDRQKTPCTESLGHWGERDTLSRSNGSSNTMSSFRGKDWELPARDLGKAAHCCAEQTDEKFPLDHAGLPQSSAHISALMKLVKEIPEFLLGSSPATSSPSSPHSLGGMARSYIPASDVESDGMPEIGQAVGSEKSGKKAAVHVPSPSCTPSSTTQGEEEPRRPELQAKRLYAEVKAEEGGAVLSTRVPCLGTCLKASPGNSPSSTPSSVSIRHREWRKPEAGSKRSHEAEVPMGGSLCPSDLKGAYVNTTCLTNTPPRILAHRDSKLWRPEVAIKRICAEEVQPGLVNCLKDKAVHKLIPSSTASSWAANVTQESQEQRKLEMGMKKIHAEKGILSRPHLSDLAPANVPHTALLAVNNSSVCSTEEDRERRRPEMGIKRSFVEGSLGDVTASCRCVNCLKEIPGSKYSPSSTMSSSWTCTNTQGQQDLRRTETDVKTCLTEVPSLVTPVRSHLPVLANCPSEIPVNKPTTASVAIRSTQGESERRTPEAEVKGRLSEETATGNTPLHDLLNYLKKIIVNKSSSANRPGNDTATGISRGSMVPRKPETGMKRSHTEDMPSDGDDRSAKFLKEDTLPEAEGSTEKTNGGTARKILGDDPSQGPNKQITLGLVHTAETKESQAQEINQMCLKLILQEGKKPQVKKEFEESDKMQDERNPQTTWPLEKESLQEISLPQSKASLQEVGQSPGKEGLLKTRQLQSKGTVHAADAGNLQEMRRSQDKGNLREIGKIGAPENFQEVVKVLDLEKLQQVGQLHGTEKSRDQRNLREAEKLPNEKYLKKKGQQQEANKLQGKENLQEAGEHQDKEERQLYEADKLQEKETVQKSANAQDSEDEQKAGRRRNQRKMQKTGPLQDVERRPKSEQLESEENLQETEQLRHFQEPGKLCEAAPVQQRDKVPGRKLQKQGRRQWEGKTPQEPEKRKLQEKANLSSWQIFPSWLATPTSRGVDQGGHLGKLNGNIHIKGLMKLMQDVLVSETGHGKETIQQITAEAGEMQCAETKIMRPPQMFYNNGLFSDLALDDATCPQDLAESIIGSGDSVLSDDTSWSLENVDSSYSALSGIEKVVSDFAETASVSPLIVVNNPTTDRTQETCGKRKCSRADADETTFVLERKASTTSSQSQYLYLREEMGCFPEPADFSYSALCGMQKVVNKFAENGYFRQFPAVNVSASNNTPDASGKNKSQRLKADLCHASPRRLIDSTNNPQQRLPTQAVPCGLSTETFFLPEWSSNTAGLQKSLLNEELNWTENVDSSYSALSGMEKVVSDFAETGSVSPLVVVKTPASDRVQETSVKNKTDRAEAGLCKASPSYSANISNDLRHRQHIQTILYIPPGMADSSYSALSGMEKVVSDFAETGSVSPFIVVSPSAGDHLQEARARNKGDAVEADRCSTSKHMVHGSSILHRRQQTAASQGFPTGTDWLCRKPYHGQECEPSIQCIDLTEEEGMPCRTDKASVLATKKRSPSADNRKFDSSGDHGPNEHCIDLTEEEDMPCEMDNAKPLRLAPANKERKSSNGGHAQASDVDTQYIDLTKEDVESDPDRNKPLDPGSMVQEGHGPAFGVSSVNKHLSGLEKLLQEMPALVFKDPTSSTSRCERREPWWYKSSSTHETWENQRERAVRKATPPQ
uniref:Uncharacterized protein LOC117354441 isoform X4 n=1 Tax=Geotrypetes seraphini TaxID=260995 RepID=A0A6P8QMC5_GEOSA|nr:uncharacterized protein LOC117354441 isoform X4 [Geotrypetes seraphini]